MGRYMQIVPITDSRSILFNADSSAHLIITFSYINRTTASFISFQTKGSYAHVKMLPVIFVFQVSRPSYFLTLKHWVISCNTCGFLSFILRSDVRSPLFLSTSQLCQPLAGRGMPTSANVTWTQRHGCSLVHYRKLCLSSLSDADEEHAPPKGYDQST